jgi:hypothetical protein
MRDIFILIEIWVKIKYINFGRHIACVKYICLSLTISTVTDSVIKTAHLVAD